MAAGKGGSSSPSSSPPRTSPICCMCGDRGLSEELFRCKTCQFRFQHKYCSNLYPRAETYHACNWCLIDQNNFMSSSDSNGGSGLGEKKLRRSSSAALHLNKPIKKQRLPDKSSSNSIDSMSPETRSQAKQAFRGKVRRYKLLEEVSS